MPPSTILTGFLVQIREEICVMLSRKSCCSLPTSHEPSSINISTLRLSAGNFQKPEVSRFIPVTLQSLQLFLHDHKLRKSLWRIFLLVRFIRSGPGKHVSSGPLLNTNPSFNHQLHNYRLELIKFDRMQQGKTCFQGFVFRLNHVWATLRPAAYFIIHKILCNLHLKPIESPYWTVSGKIIPEASIHKIKQSLARGLPDSSWFGSLAGKGCPHLI